MDRNHCAKCIHLKKNKEGKKTSEGTTYYSLFSGMYVCFVGGRFWSSRFYHKENYRTQNAEVASLMDLVWSS